MTLPRIATREEWLAERKALLTKEKALTKQRDALNTERRQLPMVEITKDYAFSTPDGAVGLLDLFEGRRQLITYHFMFHPDWEDGCPSCSAAARRAASSSPTRRRRRRTVPARSSGWTSRVTRSTAS